MENQGPGLLACDEELFARVWGRVTANTDTSQPAPASPQPTPTSTPPQTAIVPAATPSLPTPQPAIDPTAAALQRWVLHLLTDAEAYRVISRRAGQNRGVLSELGQGKQRGARTLAAEYFLRSGVRYWPRNALQNLQNQPFLPTLRGLYQAERRQEDALRAQAAQEEPELANRYLQLADAARAAANRLRTLLESLF